MITYTVTARICSRCSREIHPWPLKRGNLCSPKLWAYCIRNDGLSDPELRAAVDALPVSSRRYEYPVRP